MNPRKSVGYLKTKNFINQNAIPAANATFARRNPSTGTYRATIHPPSPMLRRVNRK